MPLLCLFTDRCESRGPCSDGTPSVRHARKRREKAIVSDLGPQSPEQMGTSRDARKGRAFIGLKPCEASFGLQKIITFLSFKKSQRSPKGIKGGTVQSAAKRLAVKHAVGGDSGLSIRASRGQEVSRAGLTRPCTSPATTFCVTLGRSPSFPEPWFTHLYTRELHLMLSKGPPLGQG